MRSILRSLFALGLLCLGACAPPASHPVAAPGAWAADEAQILAALRASAEAWNQADMQGHLAIYDESVTFMTGSGPRPGVGPIEEAFLRVFWHEGRPKQMLRFENVALRPLGRDAALQTGQFILSGGDEPDRSGWFTLVWVRTPEGWRAVHDHSS